MNRTIPLFSLPSLSKFGGEPFQLHADVDDPIVYLGDMVGGVSNVREVTACKVTGATYTSCYKDKDYFHYTCTEEEKYVDLRDYPRLVDWEELERTVSISDLFVMEGSDVLAVAPPLPHNAASLYAAVRNTAVSAQLSCTVRGFGTVDSCLMMELDPTNESPVEALGQVAGDALYHFEEFAVLNVPMFQVTDKTNASQDVQMNGDDNGLTTRLEETRSIYGCQGENAEYMAEDGSWLSAFFSAEEGMLDLSEDSTRAFYVTGTGLFSPTVQTSWEPNLSSTLDGRIIRMPLTCFDYGVDLAEENIGEGYAYWGIGTTPYRKKGGLKCEDEAAAASVQFGAEAICGSTNNTTPSYPKGCGLAISSNGEIGDDYWRQMRNNDLQGIELPPYSELKTLKAGYPLNDPKINPIVDVVTDEAVSLCSITSVEYMLCVVNEGGDQYTCEPRSSFPDLAALPKELPTGEGSQTVATLASPELMIVDFFKVTSSAKNGVTLYLAPFTADRAVSFYSAIRDSSISITMQCEFKSGATKESCLVLDLKPQNESPDILIHLDAHREELYNIRYATMDPVIPMLKSIDADSMWEIATLTQPDNGIQVLYPYKGASFCEGAYAQYLGEDGTWYNDFLGDDGLVHSMDWLLQVVDNTVKRDKLLPAVAKGLARAWEGRVGRMWMSCKDYNGGGFPRGFIYFGIGDSWKYSLTNGIACENYADYDFPFDVYERFCLEQSPTSLRPSTSVKGSDNGVGLGASPSLVSAAMMLTSVVAVAFFL